MTIEPSSQQDKTAGSRHQSPHFSCFHVDIGGNFQEEGTYKHTCRNRGSHRRSFPSICRLRRWKVETHVCMSHTAMCIVAFSTVSSSKKAALKVFVLFLEQIVFSRIKTQKVCHIIPQLNAHFMVVDNRALNQVSAAMDIFTTVSATEYKADTRRGKEKRTH